MQVDLEPPYVDERRRLTGRNVAGSVKLEVELDSIICHWPAATPPNPQHIHIIVELPSW